MPADPSPPNRLAAAVDRLVSLRAPQSRATRLALAAVAVGLFVVLVVVAVGHLPDELGGVRWWLVVMAGVVGVPATLAVNAAEYRALARLAGVDLPYGSAWRVTLAGSTANLLPIPGSVAVRAAHLRRQQAPYRGIGLATAAVAATYVGITLVVTGGFLVATARVAAAVALGLGAVALVGGVVLVHRCRPASMPAAVVRLAAVELASVAVGAARLGCLLAALGEPSVRGAVSLVAADVLAAAIGFLPSGLGLRELLAGLLGPLADVPASIGVVATALDRVVTAIVLGLLAALTARRRR